MGSGHGRFHAPLLVGVAGHMHAGKDTLCRVLAAVFTALPTEEARFAAAIKGCLAAATGTSYKFQNSVAGKNAACAAAGMSYGRMQVAVGSAARAAFGPDIWLRAALAPYLEAATASVAACTPVDGLVLIPDLRFPNEAAAIRAAGGVLLRITGDPSGGAARDLRDPHDPTETALDAWSDWDAVIDNDTPCPAGEDLSVALRARFEPAIRVVARTIALRLHPPGGSDDTAQPLATYPDAARVRGEEPVSRHASRTSDVQHGDAQLDSISADAPEMLPWPVDPRAVAFGEAHVATYFWRLAAIVAANPAPAALRDTPSTGDTPALRADAVEAVVREYCSNWRDAARAVAVAAEKNAPALGVPALALTHAFAARLHALNARFWEICPSDVRVSLRPPRVTTIRMLMCLAHDSEDATRAHSGAVTDASGTVE